MVVFLFLSMRKREFSFIAPSEEIRAYAQTYIEQHKDEASLTSRQVKHELQDQLLAQWATAGDVIRVVNEKRAQHRERAGRGLLASIMVILALISVSVIQLTLSQKSGESRHASTIAPTGAKPRSGPTAASPRLVRQGQPPGVSQDEGTHDWVDLP
jgi:hypothetical protein